MLPLIVTPVLPLIDFYNHVARFYVLSHLTGSIAQGYEAAWAILPNLGLDLLATPLFTIVEPLLGAKLILATIILTQYFGVLFLYRVLWPRAPLTLPAVLLTGLLYSYVLNWGFANFLLALGLAFGTAALWLRLRNRLALATIVCSSAALAIFLCHGFAFALYGALVGGLELGRWLTGDRKSVRELVIGCISLAAQALLPTLLFVSTATATAESPNGSMVEKVLRHTAVGSLDERLGREALYRVQTIVRVAESPSARLDYFTFCLSVGAIFVGLYARVIEVRWSALPALALFAFLMIVTPPSLFGVGYVSDRIPLTFAMLAVAAIAPRTRDEMLLGTTAKLTTLLALVAALRIAYISIYWSEYGQEFQQVKKVTASVSAGTRVGYVFAGGDDPRGGPTQRCQMYGPLLVPLRGAAVPLFVIPGAQPLRLRGVLEQAATSATSAKTATTTSYNGSNRNRADAGAAAMLRRMAADRLFDEVLICDRDRLGRLPANLQQVTEAGRLSLFRIE